MPRITQEWINALGPAERPAIYYDTETEGFAVRIYASGRKSFIAEWREPGANRKAAKRRLTIGPCDGVKVSKAREKVRQLMGQIRLGEDPAAERKAKREELTLAEASAEYRTIRASRWKASTKAVFDAYWTNHINPRLGSKRLSEITPRDVIALHRHISDVEKARIVANRVVSQLRACWNWLATFDPKFDLPNPTKGARDYLNKEQHRQRYLSPDEIKRLFAAIDQAETTGVEWPSRKVWQKHTPGPEHRRSYITANTANAIRLLAFTGCRLREVLNLTWGEVDFDRGVLWLKDSKTGRKTVVLSGASIAILAGMAERLESPPHSDAPVFVDQPADVQSVDHNDATATAEDEAETPALKPRADLHRPWKTVCRAAGLPDDTRIHDLRHSVASLALQNGLSLPMIAGLLGHRSPQTSSRYAHLDHSSQRRSADLVAGSIERALIGAGGNANG
jgi:integrase